MVGPALGGTLAAIDVDLPVFVTAGLALTVAILSVFLLTESLAPDKRIAPSIWRAVHPFAVFRGVFRGRSCGGSWSADPRGPAPFGFFVNNFSVLALDAISWSPTAIGLLTACVGVIDIAIQGVLLGFPAAHRRTGRGGQRHRHPGDRSGRARGGSRRVWRNRGCSSWVR